MSSDEYFPTPQTRAQREVEARTKTLGDALAKKRGMSRRAFFATASGMAAAFLAMNEVYGTFFEVSRAEAQDKDKADERAKALAGQPGWLDRVDREIKELKPDSFKGYTIGDNTNKATSKYPWRLDDEKLVYPFYERMVKAGLVNICIHKGLFSPSIEQQFPHLLQYSDVRDIGKAAKDWPQLNFVIYHSAYRLHPGNSAEQALKDFDRTGRIEWVTDLAEIPAKFGVKNVYGDLGQLFAHTAVSQPRLNAALMGTLIKGLGHDHVIWGTDALWTGAPQWQVEALRRLEIPEEVQKQYGFAPLGPADGPVKNAILGENVARLYNFNRRAELESRDRLIAMKEQYVARGGGRSNLRYGYIVKS